MRKFYQKSQVALIVSAVLSAPMAIAQESEVQEAAVEKTIEKISILGSRIKRKDLITASPTITTTAEDFAQAGIDTVDDYLRQLPQFQPGQGSFTNTTAGGTVGQSTLNLRGLGAQRTLVLLDGRRMQSSSANGAIDINTLPTNAIGGVEVISGGASATYGSDALAGVVNFNSRTLDGLEVTAKLTQPQDGDSQSMLYGAAFGTEFANSEGNFFISAEYVDREGVTVKDKAFFLDSFASGFTPYTRITPGAGIGADAVNDLFAGYGLSGISNRSFFSVNDDGSVFAVSGGKAYNYKGSTEAPMMVGEDGSFGYHPAYYNYVQAPLKRSALFSKFDYNINEDIKAYGHFQYSGSKASNIGSEPISAGIWAVNVPVTNPSVVANPDFAALLASRSNPTAPIGIHARFVDVGPRTYTTESSVWQGLAGLNGYVEDYDLTWDVHLSQGRSVNTDKTTAGAVNFVKVQELADAADGGDSICAGGYSPFNGVNQLSSACVTHVTETPENETVLEQTVIEAIAEGLITELPAGEARFSVGAHYRKNSYEFTPDENVAAGNLASVAAIQHTQGEISVRELSAEVYIPLLADEEFAESLNLTLGYRLSDYNLSGTASTYKAEFDWRPVSNVLLRTGFQHALRAPNVDEYFNAGTQAVVGIGDPTSGAGDPCDSRHPARSGENGAQIQALCIATGTPAGVLPRYRRSTNSLVATTYGDQNLEPEEAETITVGAVIESPFEGEYLEGMSLTVDYYNIEFDKAIDVIAAGDSLAKCHNLDGSNPEYSTDNFFCQQFVRNGDGDTDYINQPFLNLGGYKTSGVDISFNWTMPAKFIGDSSTFEFNSFVNHLNRFEVSVFEGDPFQDRAGTVSGSDAYAEWKSVNSLTLKGEDYSVTARLRYFSEMDDSSTITNPESETEGSKSYSYLDISGQYQVTENFSLRAGINNVTDKQPPIIGGIAGTTNRGIFDSIGRTAYVQVTYSL